MQRAVDIPSSYLEALVADDDDGDLLNGTPNQCTITTAFGAHGLADPSLTVGITTPVRDAYQISFDVADPTQSECPGPTVMGATVQWRPRGGTGSTINLANATATTWSGLIPQQGDGTVIEYRVEVKLSDGTTIGYPRNAADPYYQFYVGEVTKLWCSDFENGAADWTHSANPISRDEWEVGAPMGLGGDPAAAFGGTNVFGIDLTSDGQYRTSATTYAETPEIDLQGNTKNIHLQYRRWLGIEDGFYDQAAISANSIEVWKSFASAAEPMAAGVDHVDREWRFQDVDVTAQAASGKMKLRFGLSSDEGLEFSGWNLDDVCIVVAAAPPAATCGDYTLQEGETCEDGNGDDGDGCSASCQVEDEGGGGCCSSTTNPAGAAGLGALVFGLMFRRRRRR
ncbi:MAG: hypothetical protein H0T79_04555 [Deltaproteobacteria bacterium]|nr:hypothetical protein [Deltaproteobacteria bacterium]